ncbi:hypothetical protein L6R52_24960 [Myxococcota bacterium]|nr:hypothetical protein [Myxococcota bacterium]
MNVEIIWVLEQDTSFVDGTAQSCRTFVNGRGSDKGWCVGDGQTMPTAGEFDDSPFSAFRGFDMLVRKSDMHIIWTTNHGTPSGNENLTSDQILAELRQALGR